MVIRIYFEGGRHLREGFNVFFTELRDLARSRRGRVDLISGGSKAVQDFMTALTQAREDYVVLLLDCEGPSQACTLETLRARFRGVWHPPAGTSIGDDRVFRMTQIMESWFIADPASLARYYRQGFREGALPRQRNVEDVLKQDILRSLAAATRDTQKGSYKKGVHDAAILRMLDTQCVRTASAECDRMFTTLSALLNGSS